jgi:shikimate kinase
MVGKGQVLPVLFFIRLSHRTMISEASNRIFLTGFMGAGKSTIGKLLANLLMCPFVDIDELIVRQEGRTIAEIFTADGEDTFRDCETKALKSLCQQPPAVYATGGGIVLRAENRREMKNHGRIVYLKADWPTLMNRLQQSVGRPLVDPEKGWDVPRTLWLERLPFYEEADIVVDTDGLTPLAAAQKIAAHSVVTACH